MTAPRTAGRAGNKPQDWPWTVKPFQIRDLAKIWGHAVRCGVPVRTPDADPQGGCGQAIAAGDRVRWRGNQGGGQVLLHVRCEAAPAVPAAVPDKWDPTQ